jgi:hypothetical protein
MGALVAGSVNGPPTYPGYQWVSLRHLWTLGQPGTGRTYAHAPGDPITEAERALHGWLDGMDVEVL